MPRFRAIRGRAFPERRLTPGRLAVYAWMVVTSPFRVTPDEVVRLSSAERTRARRAELLRLFLACTLSVGVFLLLPAAVLGHAELASLVRLALVLALALLALRLNHAGRTTSAGLLFLFGTVAIVVHFLVTNPGGMDLQVVLTYALLALLILLAGLIVPGWATWLAALVIVAVTVVGVFALPLAPSLRAAMVDPQQLRFAIAGPLVTLQLFVAVLSWVTARTSGAGLQAAARAFERERELAALKDQFITNVNHELRTPAMAVQGYLKLLRLRQREMAPERRAAVIEQAGLAADDLTLLLTSILDTQRLEMRGEQLVPAAVEVRVLVEAAARLVDPREGMTHEEALTERELRVHIPAGLAVWADEVRVRQVLTNLLSNAIKYSEPGAPVDVMARTVTLSEQLSLNPWPFSGHTPGTAMVEIAVRDYGLGIPPEQAPLLFERFVRLPRDLASTVIGNGLGLHLCKTLVEAMGGRIWIESSGEPGEGATFRFTLPAPPTADADTTRVPAGQSAIASETS